MDEKQKRERPTVKEVALWTIGHPVFFGFCYAISRTDAGRVETCIYAAVFAVLIGIMWRWALSDSAWEHAGKESDSVNPPAPGPDATSESNCPTT
jgi:hypothetical protein